MKPHPFSAFSRPIKVTIIILLLLALLGVFTVMIHAASQNSILGADFYTFWAAGRAAFIDHANPYSQAVTEQIQLVKLGHLAQPGEDQVAFAYPPHSLLAIIPAIYMPFDWASAFWLAVNILVLTGFFFTFSQKVRGFLLSSFLFFPFFLNLVLGTFDIAAAAGFLLFYGAYITHKRVTPLPQAASAILMAWATMKPQFVWLLLGFTLLVAVREKYLVFLKTFLAAFASFLLFSFILVPTWVQDWVHQVQAYTQYVHSHLTISEFLLPFLPEPAVLLISYAALIICGLIAILLLVRWWKGKLHWLKVAAWLGMMTYLFHLHGISYEQIIFILPLILWVAEKEQWKSPAVLFFWGSSLVISWLAFAFGMNTPAIDRAPVLFNLLWAGWLLRRPDFQL
jgi:hypothetical protein